MVLEFLSLSTTPFSGMMKRQDLLGRQNACHMYNPVKICCPPLGMHTRKINLEIKKCIFKGETSFSYLLNPTVLIFGTLESRTLKQLQLDCPLRQADTYIELILQDTVTLSTVYITQTDSFDNQIASTSHFQKKEQPVFYGSQLGNQLQLYVIADIK